MRGEDFVRPHLRDLAPYKAILPFHVLASKLGRSPEDIVKLDANENPYGPPPEVPHALATLEHANIYPDPESRRLREALSAAHAVPMENLLVGAGADELIDFLMRCVLEPGDAILDCPPTFTMYAFDAAVNAARVVAVPRREDFSIDVPAVKEAVLRERPKLLFLTSPNNPDGSLVSEDDLRELLQLPVLVVFDEAYVEFSDRASVMPWVAEHDNLVVLRTFSKCAALAGLRVGYGAFPRGLASVLWRAKQPYNLTAASEAAAVAALSNPAYARRVRDLLVAERARMAAALAQIPFLEPLPSHSNFVLSRLAPGVDGARVRDRLALEHGVMVRHYSAPELERFLRVSVGMPEHTDRLMRALRALGDGRG